MNRRVRPQLPENVIEAAKEIVCYMNQEQGSEICINSEGTIHFICLDKDHIYTSVAQKEVAYDGIS